MSDSTVFTKTRSRFWVRINGNEDGSYNIYCADGILDVIRCHYPELDQASPTGWKRGKNDTHNIWIPADKRHDLDMDAIRDWCEFAGNQCVWLKCGRHIEDEFDGTEIDHCVAGDFNFEILDGDAIRTPLGEAEFKLKYHPNDLSGEEYGKRWNFLTDELGNIYDLMPCESMSLVSAVPSQSIGGLDFRLAQELASSKGVDLMAPRLIRPKPKMKGLSIAQKARAWNQLYADNAIELNQSVAGRDVMIVDDLYQSGITMWAYARFLKSSGAGRVFGLVCVKSMKDTDNQ